MSDDYQIWHSELIGGWPLKSILSVTASASENKRYVVQVHWHEVNLQNMEAIKFYESK